MYGNTDCNAVVRMKTCWTDCQEGCVSFMQDQEKGGKKPK